MENQNKKSYSEMDVKELMVQLSTQFSQSHHDHPSEETIKMITKLSTSISNLDSKVDKMDSRFEPIADNYKTAITLGKWFMGVLIFLGALLSVLIECKKIFVK